MRWTEAPALALGLRYVLGRRDILGGLALGGMALGVALLIVSLSVMNGFERALRERILTLVPHLQLVSWQTLMPESFWRPLQGRLQGGDGVLQVLPFVELHGLVRHGGRSAPVLLYGINHRRNKALEQLLGERAAQALDGGGLVLGDALARRLGADVGDNLALMFAPAGPGHSAPPPLRLRIAALHDSGTALDGNSALMNLGRAAALLGDEGFASGLRLVLADPMAADALAASLAGLLPAGTALHSWGWKYGNLHSAIQMSRQLVLLLVLLVLLVAAFNVAASLVLVSIDKQNEMAVLKTLGARRRTLVAAFAAQGLFIALGGTALGVLFGAGLAAVLGDALAWLEAHTGLVLFAAEAYALEQLPADLRWGQVCQVAAGALASAVLASLLPALRAQNVMPARLLRGE